MKDKWWEEKHEPFLAELFAEGWKGDALAVALMLLDLGILALCIYAL